MANLGDADRGPAHGAGEGEAARWWAVLLACLAALLVVRLAALTVNRTDLFFDEAQYWYWSTTPAFGYYSKPPLIAWLIGASTAVCGTSEFCVRLPSPIVHTLTALAVAWLGARLYDVRSGVLAGVAFAMLPGVSLSAGIISTDVPLLLAWALALVGYGAMFQTRAWWPAMVFGVAFGAGLNAKYAMAWFLMCIAVHVVSVPARRGILWDARLWVGLAIGLAAIVPNLAWNHANGFATFAHTADNAKWQGALGHPGKAAEFFLSQFGVFGPFYFAGLIVIAWRVTRRPLADADRLLLAFSVPLILAVTAQAFLSRAHANWAAPAYVAATVLVIATLVREASWRWLSASYGLHVAVLLLIVTGTAFAGAFVLPGGADPFARTLGWNELARATSAELERARRAGQPYAAVLTDDRSVSATLLYYLRAEPTPVKAWRCGTRPLDHFEMTRPYGNVDGEPVLLVSLRNAGSTSLGANPQSPVGCPVFREQSTVATQDISARRVTFFALSGYGRK